MTAMPLADVFPDVPEQPPATAVRVLTDDSRYRVYDDGNRRWRFDKSGLKLFIEYASETNATIKRVWSRDADGDRWIDRPRVSFRAESG